MEICTIGFTQKSAAQFFEALKRDQIRHLIDVRLNNVSQLSGFSKMNDLQYFLNEICAAKYTHLPLLAPTQQMLDEYKKKKCGWSLYAEQFLELMKVRQIETKLDQSLFIERTVLLCSELSPEHCHRRLVLEYLQRHWPHFQVKHL